ncbi:MAG: NAD-dependent epimerase/dehydratase family protein [Thermoguttaceae bacterium]
MNKVLITGASGFIGFHLVKLLRSLGVEVRCLTRAKSNRNLIEKYSVEFVVGDVCDKESLTSALRGVTTVYHLAGVTKESYKGQFFDVNTQGTCNLLEVASQMSNPPKIICVSSLAAAGPAQKNNVCSMQNKHFVKHENDKPLPVSPYGKSKLAAEKVAFEMSQKVPCSIVRPPIVFGEADVACLELFKIVQKMHIHVVPGWFNKPYSYIHAADLVELLVRVNESGENVTSRSEDTGEGIYFVAAENDITFAEFGLEIGKSLEQERTFVMHCPPLFVLIAGFFNEMTKKIFGKSGPLDLNKAKEALCGPWVCCAEKARKQLGFATAKNLQERINQTTHWYLENGML